ncbi:FHA domain-containing protein [Calothrix sp. UHCC 0171]|uniref:FHA domain-containing protein n=1 Tax=Calothrix sp. UHCC 0171 TaxID=3110245 RepID=UPI002B1F720D|nr:FHA domain-containing protein [Calothrix sp. UHCC 0171]MEA5573171.1 FHA domain-containing protein [Calothrix sp. UHCC 0171]
MIVCPNCNHPNPDGAVQCEACYTPLPATVSCPSCGASVQADASFCGQCGFNLRTAATPTVAPTVAAAPTVAPTVAAAPTVAPDVLPEVPPLVAPEPLVQVQPIVVTAPPEVAPEVAPLPPTAVSAPEPQPVVVAEPPTMAVPAPMTTSPPIAAPPPTIAPEPEPVAVVPEPEPEPEPEPVVVVPEPEPEPVAVPESEPVVVATSSPARTQLQQITGRLVHVQSEQNIELPQNLPVIHIGKPNDRIPPDVDVSGFSNSEIVSRIHADIRVEGDAYYIEDVGSSNGTYINNLPLLPGNRHRLRPGDRIGLGKGDLVTFLFQTVEI